MTRWATSSEGEYRRRHHLEVRIRQYQPADFRCADLLRTALFFQQINYTFDVLGDRIGETVTNWSGPPRGNMFTTGRGRWLRQEFILGSADAYVAGVGFPGSLARAGRYLGTEFLLSDHLGSVRLVQGSDGSVLAQMDYDAFGSVTTDTNQTEAGRLSFQEGGTGFGPLARFALQGAGIQSRGGVDGSGWIRLGFGGGDSNQYRFVGNGPTDATDPSGQFLVVPLVDTGWIAEVSCHSGFKD